MSQSTTLLDPMNVLSEVIPDTSSSDGPLIIADREWLANSLLPSVILTSAATCDLRPDVSSGEDAFCLEIPFTEKPLISCLIRFTDPLFLNVCKLIDMATDALAKDFVEFPRVGYSEEDLPWVGFFDWGIIDRVRRFLLDELPETLVETLGHLPVEVYGSVWFDLPSYYQLMYLLSSRKAGFNVPFMYHALPTDPGFPCADFLPLTSSTNWEVVSFYFDCGPLLGFDEGYDEDFYLPRYLLDFATSPEEKTCNNYQRWQVLSFEDCQLVEKAELARQVLAYGICSIASDDLIRRFFAKEVVRRGVRCNLWQGIYKPAIVFD